MARGVDVGGVWRRGSGWYGGAEIEMVLVVSHRRLGVTTERQLCPSELPACCGPKEMCAESYSAQDGWGRALRRRQRPDLVAGSTPAAQTDAETGAKRLLHRHRLDRQHPGSVHLAPKVTIPPPSIRQRAHGIHPVKMRVSERRHPTTSPPEPATISPLHRMAQQEQLLFEHHRHADDQ
jgi:hypothetical protein